MKGKIDVRFAMPNIARLRSRLENPPQELTSDLREALKSAVVQSLNEANLSIKAKMIEYVGSRQDLKFKTKQHQSQVMNLTAGIFESVFAADANSLNALISDESEEDEAAEEVGDEPGTQEGPATVEAKKTKKAEKAIEPEANEFED